MLDKIKNWRNRRFTEMEEAAVSLGLDYQRKDDFGLIEQLKDFKLFQLGGGKKITNLLTTRKGMGKPDIRIFDYQYIVSTGNSAVTFKQTVFFIQSKELNLPQFLMKPEHFFHRIGALLGWDDIDFEKHPEFSKKYYLKGEEEALVRDMMTDNVLRYFTLENDWSLEGLNYYMILYKNKKIVDKESIQKFHKKGSEIYMLLKKSPENF